MPAKKKVAPAPAGVKKASAAPAKPQNPLFEKRPKTFGIGNAPKPVKDLTRFVKWPKYVRTQRQVRVLKMRLKVPPSINQFTKALDKNQAEVLYKLLLKYQPESKTEKKERLMKEAEARSGGQEVEKKKPICVKYGLNHVTQLIESGKAQLVMIAHDVDPLELVIWLPALCKKQGIPYCIIKGKARLGQIVHKKTAACCALTAVKPEDQRELAQIVETCKNNYNNVKRTSWGGGIMGPKSQHKMLKRERAIAREQEKRLAVAQARLVVIRWRVNECLKYAVWASRPMHVRCLSHCSTGRCQRLQCLVADHISNFADSGCEIHTDANGSAIWDV
eukprot:TRINITY_DN1951_c0_g1_i3.p1 TRINITY_DN1951_c0_g1~~TRINITY_DN1951_c0_g1_i3.p1  ORF type:complete len:333 (-),score=25.34 TRINITY_DN1951_c0_g1_i3:26-1024(-)